MANAFKQAQDAKREGERQALINDCRELRNAGKLVEAVRKYRAATGASLAEAQRVLVG